MPKVLNHLRVSLCALSFFSLTALAAEEANPWPEAEAVPEAPALLPPPPVAAPPKVFHPFTGKIKGKRVRLRLHADLESPVVRELERNETVLVVGEKEGFWVVEAPAGLKAYVFRSFILDNVVEGNRVNIRLEPSVEAPIIGHLNAGDRVEGTPSPLNNKWLEIAMPAQLRLYVAKDYVTHVGGPEVKAAMDKRRCTAQQLLEAGTLLSKAELLKPFDEIDMGKLQRHYEMVIRDYADFPECTEEAQNALAAVQEEYLQKKVTFLEGKEAGAEHDEESNLDALARQTAEVTDKMKLWEPLEEAHYRAWASAHGGKTLDEYYEEQHLIAVPLTGILEAYHAPVKNKPGDYILRDKDIPVAYLYSTKVNLQPYVGKKITVLAATRPNNHFAFPAYFVLSIE